MLSTSPHVVLESIDVAYLACFNLPFHRPDVEYFSLLVCSNHFPDNNLETIAIRTPPSGGVVCGWPKYTAFSACEKTRFFLLTAQETLNARRTTFSRYARGTIDLQRIVGLFDSRSPNTGHILTIQHPEAMQRRWRSLGEFARTFLGEGWTLVWCLERWSPEFIDFRMYSKFNSYRPN